MHQARPEPEPAPAPVHESPSRPESHSYQPPAEPAPTPTPAARPRAEEPRIDAKQILNDSGLVMIETDRAKAQIQPQAVAEPSQPVGRPRRERAKPPPQDDQLVQVETRK